MGRSCLRWTVDTERAFVLALQQTGQVQLAAAAIGRHPSVCYKRRERSPDFALAWDAAVKELETARHADGLAAVAPGGAPPPAKLTRTRTDGWTQVRQRQFLRALGDTGRYGEAAARIGLSYEAVRAFRARSPDFQALCDRALADGGVTLEEAAYMRAVEGWEEPIVSGGKIIGYRRRFSDTLTRTLLVVKEGGGAPARRGKWSKPLTPEDIDRKLMARLDKLGQVLKRRERQEQLDWAEDMARKGWAP